MNDVIFKKRILTVLLIALLLTGCSPGEPVDMEQNSPENRPGETVNTNPSITVTVPGKTASTELNTPGTPPSTPDINNPDIPYIYVPTPSAPDTTSPGTPDIFEPTLPDALAGIDLDNPNRYKGKPYDELKADFENYIELARQELGYVLFYHKESLLIFEEMLNHRQSLEDFGESIEYPYDVYTGYTVYIDVGPVFTDGKTTYRVLNFAAHPQIGGLVYVQIIDEESIGSLLFYSYINEGGIGGKIIHCGFIQDSNKNYLIIIHKEINYAAGIITYYLVNCKLEGKEIIKYHALNKEFSKGIWTVSGISNAIYYEPTSTVVSYSEVAFWPEYWWNLEYDSQDSFKDDTFTIILNNEAKDEISLLLKNGFWEALSKETGEATHETTMYIAYLDSADWAWLEHPDDSRQTLVNYNENGQFKITAYRILDFDGDGVLDLCFKAEEYYYNYAARPTISGFCTIMNGKVERLLYGYTNTESEYGSHVTINYNQETAKNVIVLFVRRGGSDYGYREYTRIYYSLQDGKISELETLRSTYRRDTEYAYEANGVSVREEVYQRRVNKYTNPFFVIYY